MHGGPSAWIVWAYNLAFDAGRYVVPTVGAFLVFWVWKRERWRHRLVNRAFARGGQIRRELAYSASTVLIFSLVGTGVWFGGRAGILRIYSPLALHGWAYFVFSVVALIVLQDAFFYWSHRAMHHRWLFRRVHRVHHLSHDPSPFAAYAFAPAEALVHAAIVPLVGLWMPLHRGAIGVFLAFMILRNVLGHLGLELFPRWFARSRWTRWSTTTTHHTLHHRRVGSNYGLYFTWWDRVMGTTDPSYEETFEAVDRRRPAHQTTGYRRLKAPQCRTPPASAG
ncbi:MAG: sterol desaturase family protein [Polyangiaceae bacterium]|jgi:sterol desaturase/sphingolipid hydroxylase (fatty acid hydroxylase superfamily)